MHRHLRRRGAPYPSAPIDRHWLRLWLEPMRDDSKSPAVGRGDSGDAAGRTGREGPLSRGPSQHKIACPPSSQISPKRPQRSAVQKLRSRRQGVSPGRLGTCRERAEYVRSWRACVQECCQRCLQNFREGARHAGNARSSCRWRCWERSGHHRKSSPFF